MSSATGKRPYLRGPERRRQLLDAAGRLFDRYGFGGLTMAGLAAEAGVSRQLVYGHFADLDALYVAFVEDRLARYRAAVPDVAAVPPDEVTTALFRHLLSIPPTDRRVIRLLVADVGIRALDRMRRRFLAEELTRWPALRSSPHGAALVWAATSALLALADSVDSGGMETAAAGAVARAVVEAVTSGLRHGTPAAT